MVDVDLRRAILTVQRSKGRLRMLAIHIADYPINRVGELLPWVVAKKVPTH